MSVWLVIPIRSLHDGKRRLAQELDDRQRHSLVEWLLRRTLRQAAVFPGLDRTLVVTRCERTAAYVTGRGAIALREDASAGLNGGLQQAFDTVTALQARHMLVIAADLPLVSTDDLASLAAVTSATTIAVAPDRHGTGTNGLCIPTNRPFAFSFGDGSLARHLAHIRKIAMHRVMVQRPGLAFDLDVDVDLQRLLEEPLLSAPDLAFFRALAAGGCRHLEA